MRFELSAGERAYRQRVRDFAGEVVAPRADAIDATNAYPADLVVAAARHGLLCPTLPPAWGGAGLDHVSDALAVEAVASVCATLAGILIVHNTLVAETVHRFGQESQRGQWLRRLASGAAIGAFALSEANAGADAANQQTTAIRRGAHYVLRGRKTWVANGESAGLILVFAATTPGVGGQGVSAFLLPGDAPRLRRSAPCDSLGMRGLGCVELELDDVTVPAEARLGAEGEGFRIAMWALDGGRVAVGAQALGMGQAAFDEALRHAAARKTFGRPIGEYQAVQWMLADMATELDAARMLVFRAAAGRGRSPRVTLEASMAKLSASEAAHRAADKAMQILASAGYRRGTRVDRLGRDVRATEIDQGTSEVQRMIIASQVVAAPPAGAAWRSSAAED